VRTPLAQPKADYSISHLRPLNNVREHGRPVRVTLPIYLENVCLPSPDIRDPLSTIHGDLIRGGTQVPLNVTGIGGGSEGVDLPLIDVGFESHRKFVIKDNEKLKEMWITFEREMPWLIKDSGVKHDPVRIQNMFLFNLYLMSTEFVPAPSDSDVSDKTWLESTSYTQVEKQKLLDLKEEFPNIKKEHFKCKCFVKTETYPEYKPLRMIKSTTDRFKIEVGPTFQIVNHVLFSHPEFIKKIPVNERPLYIKDLLGWAKEFSCTDYSKYESHFTALVMNLIEFPFYEYCTYKLPTGEKFMKLIKHVLAGKRKFKYKYFSSEMHATRASGEMCTSSGNGYSNFFLFKYISCCLGAVVAKGVFEGDDGLTSTVPLSCMPKSSHYTYLGFNCKMENTKEFSEASFCGLVADQDELINVCDIRKTIADVGWTTDPYIDSNITTRSALLRAKGFSLVYQYPGCPILDSLGHYILRHTDKQVIEDKMVRLIKTTQDKFKREMLLKAISEKRPGRKQPGPKTRLLVEKLYGISTTTQIKYEQYFDNCNELKPFQMELNFPVLWYKNYDNYVVTNKQFHYKLESIDLIRSIENFSGAQILEDWKL